MLWDSWRIWLGAPSPNALDHSQPIARKAEIFNFLCFVLIAHLPCVALCAGNNCWQKVLLDFYLFLYWLIDFLADKLAAEIHFFLKKHRVYCERDCFSSSAAKMFLIFALWGLWYLHEWCLFGPLPFPLSVTWATRVWCILVKKTVWEGLNVNIN